MIIDMTRHILATVRQLEGKRCCQTRHCDLRRLCRRRPVWSDGLVGTTCVRSQTQVLLSGVHPASIANEKMTSDSFKGEFTLTIDCEPDQSDNCGSTAHESRVNPECLRVGGSATCQYVNRPTTVSGFPNRHEDRKSLKRLVVPTKGLMRAVASQPWL